MRQALLRAGVLVLCTLLGSAALPAQLAVSFDAAAPSCADFTDGSLTAIATGGDGAYSYQWSNGVAGQTLAGIGAGTYTVTATDGSGATGTATFDLVAPGALAATFTQGGAGTCALTDDVTVAVTGGTAPYTYAWPDGATGASVSGIGFGSASVTVTDASGCAAVFTTQVEPPLSVEAVAQDVLCPGGCDAVVIAIVSGGTRPVTYLWDNGVTDAVNDMLLPGTYCVTVTDANGCTAQDCATVGQPDPFAFDFAVTQPACGGSDGSVTATVTGGNGGYSYAWSNGQTGRTISGLAEGTYTLTVTDMNGCSAQESVTIRGGNLVVDIDATSPACGVGNTGTATAVVTGGTAPFAYDWSNGTNGATAANLAPGMYSVTVTDAAGCTGTAQTTITAGSNLNVTATSTPQSCVGTDDGSASAMVSGGQAPYTFAWSTGSSDPVIDGLAPGTYTVTVTDAAGCSGTTTVTVDAAVALMCSVTVIDEISAAGAADGTLTAQFSGGVPPYSVSWDNGAATQTITDLGPGTYTATVTDGNGCTTTCSATLTEPVVVLGKIGDFVWRDLDRDGQQDPDEPGVNGVRVYLVYEDGTVDPNFVTTGTSGMYMFGDLVPGKYSVRFEIKLGDDVFTRANVGDDATDSDAVSVGGSDVVGMTQQVMLMSGDTILTLDAGIYDACVPVDPGTIEASETMVCGVGADVGIIRSTQPATSTAAIRYLWMVNTTNDPNFANWTPAPGTNNQASYDPGAIYEDTYFARCAFGLNCNSPVESNVVLVTVGSDARAIIDGPDVVCIDEPYTFTASNPGAGAQVAWDFGFNATPQTSNQRSVSVTYSLFGLRDVRLEVTANGCDVSAVQRIAVTNCNAPAPFVIAATPKDGHAVEVEWLMREELLPGTYEVTRSLDGGVTYEVIGTVPVDVNVGGSRYAFTDVSPRKGYNVYRVCRVLARGDTYFSRSDDVSLVGAPVEIVAFPNPAADQVTVERFDRLDAQQVIELVDDAGRVVTQVVFAAGERRKSVSLADQVPGQYFVRVVDADEVIGATTVLKQ